MNICKHLQEDNFCQTAYEGTDPESGIECNGQNIKCEYYEKKEVNKELAIAELVKKMADSIELLCKRIDGIEKTIEVHGELIDRLERKIYKHEKSDYQEGEV